MAVAPSPNEIYKRAVNEGRRRLNMPAIEQITTAFIAGVTIVFGIVALGVIEALVGPALGEDVARLVSLDADVRIRALSGVSAPRSRALVP